MPVFKNEQPFVTGSVFHEKIWDLEMWYSILEQDYKKEERNSGHFLASIIHEIMHSVYIHYIYKKHGYDGACQYTRNLYPFNKKDGLTVMKNLQHKTFSDGENNIIQSLLGRYAAGNKNQYHEVFAETFTKIICDSLSADTIMPKYNPLENFKRFPIEFSNILNKILMV